MANRKATFAKRQRETDLKDRAKQKDDRRNQKRGEVRDVKGPAIAWDEAVYAVTTPDDPPPAVDPDAVVPEERPDGPTRPGDAPARAAGDGPARAAAPAAAPAAAAPAAAAPVTPAPSAPAVKSAAAPAISGAAAGKPAASAAAPASPRRVG
jgi:translation initiation factor IF-2